MDVRQSTALSQHLAAEDCVASVPVCLSRWPDGAVRLIGRGGALAFASTCADQETNHRASCSSVYALPNSLVGFGQRAVLECAHRPKGPGAIRPSWLPADHFGSG